MPIREIFWVHTVSDASYFSCNLGLHTSNTRVSLGSTEDRGGNWGFHCEVRITDIVSLIILIVIVSSSLARNLSQLIMSLKIKPGDENLTDVPGTCMTITQSQLILILVSMRAVTRKLEVSDKLICDIISNNLRFKSNCLKNCQFIVKTTIFSRFNHSPVPENFIFFKRFALQAHQTTIFWIILYVGGISDLHQRSSLPSNPWTGRWCLLPAQGSSHTWKLFWILIALCFMNLFIFIQ